MKKITHEQMDGMNWRYKKKVPPKEEYPDKNGKVKIIKVKIMKRLFLILLVLIVSGILAIDNSLKQETTNTGINKMADPLSYTYIDGRTGQLTNLPNQGYNGNLFAKQNQIWTPGDPTTGSGGGTGAAAAATPSIDQNVLDQYDQSIGNVNSSLGRLGDQFNSGVSGIDASYSNALNQLLGAKNRAGAAYDTNVHQNQQDYIGSKNTIRSQAGGALNGLLRLLGSRGAGGGSAATITAPGAAARQATLQQNDVGNTFGHNSQDLDTNWNNYLTDYQNQVSGAGAQRDQQKQSLQGQIDANRASLLQTLAQLSGQRAQAAGGSATGAAQPYIDQANAVLDQASNYRTAPINYQTQAYNAPALSKYTFNSAKPTTQGRAATNDYVSPYLATLLGKKQLTA